MKAVFIPCAPKNFRGKDAVQAKIDSADMAGEMGFSVLEALVAMAVLAAAMLPILALQSQFVRSVAVMERTETRLSADAAIRAHIRSVNLTERPRGDLVMPGATRRWSAEPAHNPRLTRGKGGERARFEVTLYDVSVRVDYVAGHQEYLVMSALGWKPLRSYQSEL